MNARESVIFKPAAFVDVDMRRVFGELQADFCLRDLDRKTFAYRAAVYLDDINRTHAFREGNGRVQRHFLKCLALQAGHGLDIERLDQERWLEGSIRSFESQDFTVMTGCIENAIGDRARERGERGDRQRGKRRGR